MSSLPGLRLSLIAVWPLSIVCAASAQTVFTTNITIGAGNTTFENQDIVVRGCTVTIDGSHTFRSLVVERSTIGNIMGMVTHTAGGAGGGVNGAAITITNDCTIQGIEGPGIGSAISVSGRGHAAGPGAGGAGVAGAGGGYGGIGGQAVLAGGASYGNVAEPIDFGSGGGRDTNNAVNGGAGGGSLRLIVGGVLNVHGVLRADGAAGPGADAGGGAGGSLWITAGGIAGSGAISANGGNASQSGSGGAGGRIAIELPSGDHAGTVTAFGGAGGQRGGAGTVFRRIGGATGDLLVQNVGAGARTPIPASLTAVANMDVTTATVVIDHPFAVETDLSVHSGGDLSHTLANAGGLNLTVGGNVSIDTGGTIHADGRGHPSSTGPGEGGDSLAASGGGHGGFGGAAGLPGGIGYGSITDPVTFGSGGGRDTNNATDGGAGGGLIRMDIDGTLAVNGVLSVGGANGLGQDAGGGAGGSVHITTGALAGTGVIRANGGSGSQSGAGGGGGHIALFSGDNSAFAGTVQATGGGAVRRGGAGTIYTKAPADVLGDLLISNSGEGAVTPLPENFAAADAATVTNSAVMLADHGVSFQSLALTNSASITQTARTPGGLHLVIHGDMSVGAGATLNANGLGFISSEGPGQGADGTAAGGAGHGGIGWNYPGNAGAGGVYGDETKPDQPGSGGGRDTNNAQPGGAGGGVIRLEVGGTLSVDGIIRANGLSGAGADAGGGSGGSVMVTAGTLAGTGTITANGGLLRESSGSGGGGRIAIYSCNVTLPQGNFTSSGGGGVRPGAAGTVYFGSGSIAITQQPADLLLMAGEIAELQVSATGDGSLQYQWRKRNFETGEFENVVDGGTISGATTETLTISGIACGDNGTYDVLIADSCGSFPSESASIAIDPLGDFNNDGGIDGADVEAFFAAWEIGDFSSDVNQDGGVDGGDVETFFAAWEGGAC